MCSSQLQLCHAVSVLRSECADQSGCPDRPDYVIDSTFDLFVELGASDEQVSGLSTQDCNPALAFSRE